MRIIDSFLNSITMYRLVLYGLILLTITSVLFGFFGFLPYTGVQMLATLATILAACFLVNTLLSRMIRVVINTESWAITALILFLILVPSIDSVDLRITFAVGAVAMLSKYLLVINKKHLFNPAALGLFLCGLFGFGNAIWWVGSTVLLPVVLIVGFLVVRKIRRFIMFFSFLLTAVVTICLFNLSHGILIQETLVQVAVSWPIFFFGTIMLTEPLTTPPTTKLRQMYGVIVGLLFGSQFHVGPIFASPELALVVGNIFSYLVGSKDKLFLPLLATKQLSPHIYEFVFAKPQSFTFVPGQYLEWTLKTKKFDSRGNRRYFTIASSPTEKDIRLGIRYGTPASSFKETLVHLPQKDTIVAHQLAGNFVLPQDEKQKLVFIAGGIGVTPFRSMIRYLIDTKQKRDVVIFYSNADAADFAYKEIFDEAEKTLGMKVHYIVTDAKNVPQGWKGIVGRLNSDVIKAEVPQYSNRMFYLSGPDAMVNSYTKLLFSMGIQYSRIKTDYFPGY